MGWSYRAYFIDKERGFWRSEAADPDCEAGKGFREDFSAGIPSPPREGQLLKACRAWTLGLE